jgi:hypothetical protein
VCHFGGYSFRGVVAQGATCVRRTAADPDGKQVFWGARYTGFRRPEGRGGGQLVSRGRQHQTLAWQVVGGLQRRVLMWGLTPSTPAD